MCYVTFDEFKNQNVRRSLNQYVFSMVLLGIEVGEVSMAIHISQIIFRCILFATGINMALYYGPQVLDWVQIRWFWRPDYYGFSHKLK